MCVKHNDLTRKQAMSLCSKVTFKPESFAQKAEQHHRHDVISGWFHHIAFGGGISPANHLVSMSGSLKTLEESPMQSPLQSPMHKHKFKVNTLQVFCINKTQKYVQKSTLEKSNCFMYLEYFKVQLKVAYHSKTTI